VDLVFVAHRDNIAELPQYMDLVAELGVKKVSVSNLLTFRENLQSKTLYGLTEDPKVRAIFQEAKIKAHRHGIELGLPRLTPRAMGCTQSEFIFVDIDGNVAPCDFLAVHTPFYYMGEKRVVRPVIFGNALTGDLAKIWNSKAARSFRKSHREGEIPNPCSHCIDAYGMMCSRRELDRHRGAE
jgi:radical SAM protein with 4Fe4S-binding SPASM domain